MTQRQLLYWALVGGTLIFYLVMVIWSLPYISDMVGGLVAFDLRPTGYSLAEAHELLAALSPVATEFYLTTQQRLDMVYPVLLTATLGFGLWNLTAGWPKVVRWLLVGVALLGGGADYAENFRVAVMLRAGADNVDAAMVQAASGATVLKSGATSLAMMALLGLALVHGGRRARRTMAKK
jgi:hypothetical protein